MKRALLLILLPLMACQSELPRQPDATPLIETVPQLSPAVPFSDGPRVLTETEQDQFFDATVELLCLTLRSPSKPQNLSPEQAEELRRALVKYQLDGAGLELRLRAYHRHQSMQDALTQRLQERCPEIKTENLKDPLEVLPLHAMQQRQSPQPPEAQPTDAAPIEAKPYLLAFTKLSCIAMQGEGDLKSQRRAVLQEGGWTDETWAREGARWREDPRVVSACARALRTCTASQQGK